MLRSKVSSYLVIVFIMSLVSCNDSNLKELKIITSNELPDEAHAFIQKHFPSAAFRRVDMETSSSTKGSTYNVKLEQGQEFIFDEHGNWIRVNGAAVKIPSQILPQRISGHLNKYYPAHLIKVVTVKNSGYHIQLSNDKSLHFENSIEPHQQTMQAENL